MILKVLTVLRVEYPKVYLADIYGINYRGKYVGLGARILKPGEKLGVDEWGKLFLV